MIPENRGLTNPTDVTPTPSTQFQPLSTAKCVLPASVSGKAYSVTPTIWGPKTVSSTVIRTSWNCDPIPAASINKGNFQFSCKTLIGKNVGDGAHTISWNLPAAASISINPYTFIAMPPYSTPKYIVNTALAKTTLIPTSEVLVETTATKTTTLRSTTTIRATSTCFYTVTVTPTPGIARLRRALEPGHESPAPDAAAVDADDLAYDAGNNDTNTDAIMDLKERAAVTRILHAAVTPTLGKPDFTYPPFGVTTIYVKSISTSTYSALYYITTITKTLPGVNTTTVYAGYTTKTVTVTVTPTA